VELSPAEELYQRPIMPYTEALLSAVPVPDPDLAAKRKRIVLEGDVPSPITRRKAAASIPAAGTRPRCAPRSSRRSSITGTATCGLPTIRLNVDAATLAAVHAAPESPVEADESALPPDTSGESNPVVGETGHPGQSLD